MSKGELKGLSSTKNVYKIPDGRLRRVFTGVKELSGRLGANQTFFHSFSSALPRAIWKAHVVLSCASSSCTMKHSMKALYPLTDGKNASVASPKHKVAEISLRTC
jgi:hypothetical protein